MIYKFKSKATGDLLMLGPQGNQFLALLGREAAPKGIIEWADMPAAIATLQRAAEADDAHRAEQARQEAAEPEVVSLRQRLWPMIEMMRQAHAAQVPIVWGV